VLIEVHASGVGNWDNIVRSGGWDIGIRPPMALGAARELECDDDPEHFRERLGKLIKHKPPEKSDG
jgi:hypothetical protein